MPVKLRKLLGAALFGMSFFFTGPAAAVLPDTVCSPISGNGVTITECSNGYTGDYGVLNQSGFGIYKFFVSTKAPTHFTRAWTTRENWSSQYISESMWDSNGTYNVNGSFDSLFGEEDTGVFGYSHYGESSDTVIGVGEDTGQTFFFGYSSTSEFIAIGGQSTIIARSFNAPASDVPEPGSLALLGLGIAGLAVVRRKRQTKK